MRPAQLDELQQLIRHMSMYTSDYAIVHGLDCVLGGCIHGRHGVLKGCCDEVAAGVEAYAKARRKAAGFRPRLDGTRYPPNNHRAVDPALVESISSGSASRPTTCAVCERPFVAIRKSAKYCSDSCKRLGDRKGAKRVRASKAKDSVSTHV